MKVCAYLCLHFRGKKTTLAFTPHICSTQIGEKSCWFLGFCFEYFLIDSQIF